MKSKAATLVAIGKQLIIIMLNLNKAIYKTFPNKAGSK